ncbi:tyrosine-type recombinase/integrase [Shewanella sp. 1_MG-2023]|uniref:tyrosine-type recombinase/integrase n=1 Tax=unclassified Shewanella TaxID=196818 RepID=UPI0026E22D66|nr:MULTISPECIES: tyrosine-type recombinase/integrase [unclassified Shewanella]MDO6610540.1 tyrosine-type recombinase/integrase [Shewanella sp. 7_MG-2023]MDO6770665.1 tyrosine-type recombinase/integrase [Shewanella sp. 2_MG-2023]MDO6795051.1 tyrosine-type recombinase/integrase [Shewanella sp. 1_MG-2023]
MRTRKTNDSWMPPFVYLHKRAGVAESYVLKRHNSTKVLCKSSASKAEVWQAYESEIAEMSSSYTVNRLVIDYLNSTNYSELAPRTQKDRDIELKRFSNVFGEMKPDDIRAPDIRQYMDLRGQASKTQANHELAAASVMFGWGFERGKCNSNPTKGVKKFKLKTRDRYISDTEYNAVLACAEQRLRIAIEISYLCAARQGDVLQLTWEQIYDNGIFIQQSKTGKKQIKEWSNRLRKVIDEAKLLHKDCNSPYVINKKHGGKLTADGLRSAWKRAKLKMEKDYPNIERTFTFHDIKAKGISDFEGTMSQKQQFSGHKTMEQLNTYDRKVTVVPTIGSSVK